MSKVGLDIKQETSSESALLGHAVIYSLEFSVKVFIPPEQCDYNFQQIPQVFSKTEKRIFKET